MKTYIGIDLGGTIVKTGFVQNGRIVNGARMEILSNKGLQSVLDKLAVWIDSQMEKDDVLAPEGIAIAFPGIVDTRACRVVSTNAKYDDAPSLDLMGWAANHWGIPLRLDNDARMATVGEWRYGAGRGRSNLVMMTLGTGIGTGVVIDGRPLRGKTGMAGSLGGHLTINYKGRRCSCGNTGCVEAHSSSYFLDQIINENQRLSASFRSDSSVRNFKKLCELYRSKDVEATLALEGCMDVWAAAIVNYIHAYDPEIVIIGGGIMKSADIILPYLEKKVASLAWCPVAGVPIVASELGDNAALAASSWLF